MKLTNSLPARAPGLIASGMTVLMLCLVATADARPLEKETVLRACEREFGAALDAKQNLFEVNASFVLEVKFDGRGALTFMSVAPKYLFEETHPEWTEPHQRVLLSRSEFAAVLSRIDTIRPRGRWIVSSIGSVVTNMTEYFSDEYENAFVERGDFADLGVRFIRIYFMHEIAGVVSGRRTCGFDFHLTSVTAHASWSSASAATSSDEAPTRVCASGVGRASKRPARWAGVAGSNQSAGLNPDALAAMHTFRLRCPCNLTKEVA